MNQHRTEKNIAIIGKMLNPMRVQQSSNHHFNVHDSGRITKLINPSLAPTIMTV